MTELHSRPDHRQPRKGRAPALLLAVLLAGAMPVPGALAQEAGAIGEGGNTAPAAAAISAESTPENGAENAPENTTESTAESTAEPGPGDLADGPADAVEPVPATPAPATSGPDAQAAPSAPDTGTDDTGARANPRADPLTLKQLIADPKLLLSRPDGADATADLSPLGMYRNADIVVKLVMLGLVLASLVTWTIWLAKLIEVFLARSRARRAARILTRAASLEQAVSWASGRGGAPAAMLRSVMTEIAASSMAPRIHGDAGLKERASSVLDQGVASASRRAAAGTSILATIGATAPFVGLFGTVWGIMNAFIGISEAQSSSLAVVAPGIAEALLATALGLVAAIPAVIIYNINARGISGYRHDLSTVAAGIERLLSRDLDFGRIATAPDPASPLAQQ